MGSEQYMTGIAITIIVLNALSAAALIFIMAIYLAGKDKTNNFPMRLIFYLCIACLAQNIYVFIDNPISIHDQQNQSQISNSFCSFEGVLKTSADLSSIIWTTLILFSAYYSIVKQKTQSQMKNLEIWFLIVGFGFPIIFACLPLAFSLYGFDGYYCWFEAQSVYTEFWLSMGFYFIPLWILFFLNIYLSTATLQCLKKFQLQEQQINVFKRLLWYPFILLITAIFSTLHKIQQVVTDDAVWLWLIILDYVFFSLYGLFNAIAYGLNPNIRVIIRQKFKCEQRDRSISRNIQKINQQILMEQLG